MSTNKENALPQHEALPTAPPPTYDEAMSQAPPQQFVPPQQYVQGPMMQPYQPPPVVPPPSVVAYPTAPNTVITTTTAVIVDSDALGPTPVRMTCPVCRANIKTSTVSDYKTVAHLTCLALFLLQCYLCCCLPYLMDCCKTVRHSCPNCKAYLGTYND